MLHASFTLDVLINLILHMQKFDDTLQFSKTLRKLFECRKLEWSSIKFFWQKIVFSKFWRIGKVSSNYSMWKMWCNKTSSIPANFKTVVKELTENRQKLHFLKLGSSLSVHMRFAVLIPPTPHSFKMYTVFLLSIFIRSNS